MDWQRLFTMVSLWYAHLCFGNSLITLKMPGIWVLQRYLVLKQQHPISLSMWSTNYWRRKGMFVRDILQRNRMFIEIDFCTHKEGKKKGYLLLLQRTGHQKLIPDSVFLFQVQTKSHASLQSSKITAKNSCWKRSRTYRISSRCGKPGSSKTKRTRTTIL